MLNLNSLIQSYGLADPCHPYQVFPNETQRFQSLRKGNYMILTLYRATMT